MHPDQIQQDLSELTRALRLLQLQVARLERILEQLYETKFGTAVPANT